MRSIRFFAAALAFAPCALFAQSTPTGTLIPLQTVAVTSPSMAAIRRLAIQPVARITDHGAACEIIGAVYSDDRSFYDGPMPGITTSLLRDGVTVFSRTNSRGIWRAVIPAGPEATTWREGRPQVGMLPSGVHATRPWVTCPAVPVRR